MVLQPVHELIPRGLVRDGSCVFKTRAVPLFLDSYPIACFTTSCQLHEGLRSLDHGTSLRSSNLIFRFPSDLSMAAVRYSCTPAILIDTDGRRCSNSNRPLINHQRLFLTRFTIGYY
jgi:hypothetical protein